MAGILGAVAGGLFLGALGKTAIPGATGSLMGKALGGGIGFMAKHKRIRNAAAGAAVGGAIYGVTHSKNMEQYYLSKYGDNEETRRAVDNVQRMGTAGAIVGGIGVGAPGVSKSVMSMAAAPAKAPFKGLSKLHKWSSDWKWTEASKNTVPREFLGGMIGKHPYMASFGAGGVLGGSMAITQSSAFKNPMAPEGNIRAINSSPTGGVYGPLQFSTQGLTLRLHHNRSRIIE